VVTRRDYRQKKDKPSPRLQGMEEGEPLPKLSFVVVLIDVGSGTVYIKSFISGWFQNMYIW
jgi:hypothetical protein